MKKYISKILCVTIAWTLLSCSSYLDVVPDNVPTIDHAFQNRGESEKYLVGLYSYLPNFVNDSENPALKGAVEKFRDQSLGGGSWAIAFNYNNSNNPVSSYFEGTNGGKPYYRALRDINIFLENIHKPYDLEDWERQQWISEVIFLKAYYHFWLFRMYGPIPLVPENIPIDEEAETVQRYREPVDSCVNFIASLLDRAIEGLPTRVSNEMRDLGKPTKVVALAVKAQLLTYAASPLFNGNTDYADYIDGRGIQLFPQEYDASKWQRAADALKKAIDAAHDVRMELYDFRTAPSSTLQARSLSEETINAMQVRGAVTEKWNSEIVWGDPRGDNGLQSACFPAFNQLHANNLNANYDIPMHIVEEFYTRNGLPISEDADWTGVDPFRLKEAKWEDRQYIHVGDSTIALHFNREARFYGSITFNHGTFYGNSREYQDNTEDEGAMWTTDYVFLTPQNRGSVTGYIAKKFVNFKTTVADNSASPTYVRYPFPIIRLADLYLMYAEALNEIKSVPDDEVYEYIDRVRRRSGLEGVVDSWRKYAVAGKKNRPADKDEMRKIIHLERRIELMFEGVRFWDLRRWKEAPTELSYISIRAYWTEKDGYGGSFDQTYKFNKEDYFWPIKISTLLRDQKLIQSPGWLEASQGEYR
jgi:hypothetical protein